MISKKPIGIINIGTGKASTWNDLANAIWKSLGRNAVIEYIEMPETLKKQYQYFTEANISKLRKLGWNQPLLSIFEGTDDYVKGYLNNTETLSV